MICCSHLAAGYSCLAVSRGLSQGLPFCHISPWSSVCSSGKHTWFLSPYRWGFPNLNHFGLMPKPNKFQCSSPSIFSPLGGCTPRGGPRDTCAGPCLAFGLLLQTVLVGGQHGGGHRDRISYPNPASALGSPGSLYAQVHHMPLSLSPSPPHVVRLPSLSPSLAREVGEIQGTPRQAGSW